MPRTQCQTVIHIWHNLKPTKIHNGHCPPFNFRSLSKTASVCPGKSLSRSAPTSRGNSAARSKDKCPGSSVSQCQGMLIDRNTDFNKKIFAVLPEAIFTLLFFIAGSNASLCPVSSAPTTPARNAARFPGSSATVCPASRRGRSAGPSPGSSAHQRPGRSATQ